MGGRAGGRAGGGESETHFIYSLSYNDLVLMECDPRYTKQNPTSSSSLPLVPLSFPFLLPPK